MKAAAAQATVDMKAALCALRQFSPVVTNVAGSVRRRLLRRYLEASSRNVVLHMLSLALLLFGFAYSAPLQSLLLVLVLVSSLIVLRERLAQHVLDGLKQGLIRSTRAHDACLFAVSLFWGAAPFVILALNRSADFYAVAFVSALAAGLNSMSYLSALPASTAYVIAPMIALALACAVRGTATGWLLALATVLFALMIIARLAANHRMMLRMLVAERKNASLIDQLQAYHERLEEENETLGASLKDVSESAMRDPLTGALNRHYLNAVASSLTERVRRRDEVITVCMVDVDHFKRINDRFGHPFGDQVLKGVVRQLDARLRENDTLARYGGEEFVVFLRNCEIDHARRVAEALRTNVANLRIDTSTGALTVTVSIGLARWHRDEDLDAVMLRADRAMYRAKEAGRNRVEADPDDASDTPLDADNTSWQEHIAPL